MLNKGGRECDGNDYTDISGDKLGFFLNLGFSTKKRYQPGT